MSDLFSDLSQGAQHLSSEERAQLDQELRASFEQQVPAETDAAWDEELCGRVASYVRGEAKLISAEDVFAEARLLTQRHVSALGRGTGASAGTKGQTVPLNGQALPESDLASPRRPNPIHRQHQHPISPRRGGL